MIEKDFNTYFRENVIFCKMSTRDAKLRSTITTPFSATISDDKKEMEIYLPLHSLNKNLKNFEDNKEIAFGVGAFPSHESYQFKGKYKSHRASNEDEIAISGEVFQKIQHGFKELMGFDDDFIAQLKQMRFEPLMTVIFEIDDIFDQSPKPGAGEKLK